MLIWWKKFTLYMEFYGIYVQLAGKTSAVSNIKNIIISGQ